VWKRLTTGKHARWLKAGQPGHDPHRMAATALWVVDVHQHVGQGVNGKVTSTLRLASWAEPVARLVLTTAGGSCLLQRVLQRGPRVG
jgi:hypothetical protein